MELQQLLCKNCCGELVRKNDTEYRCPYCGGIFEDQSAEKYNEELRDVLDEAKLEAVANARRNLYDAVTAEYISSVKVHECCSHLKQLLPDDFQARFYETAIGENARETARMIRKIHVEEESCYVETVIRFLIASLKSEYISEVGDLIERAYKQTDLVKFREYSTRLSVEAEKLDNCIYLTTYPRDVFVAYSSRDMEKVLELVECLEEQGLSCFLAARNLRHGAGSVENYETALREAMDNCQSFVFVSSMNSRNPGCDALRQEIPYIRRTDVENAPAELRNNYQNLPQKYKKHRVEYRLEESNRPVAADRIVSDFFAGYERVYSPMDVAERVLTAPISFDEEPVVETLAPTPIAAVKYCVACKGECPIDAKFCMHCTGASFANTPEEAELMQRIAAFEKEKAEFEKRKADERQQVTSLSHKVDTSSVSTQKPNVQQKGVQDTQPSSLKPKNQTSSIPETSFSKAEPPKSGNRGLKFSRKGGTYSVSGIGTCKDFSIVIPEKVDGISVTCIAAGAFKDCNYITAIKLPDSITIIEDEAFKNCIQLKSVKISNNVTSIGSYAFNGCKELTDINLPDNIKDIGQYAFQDCTRLTSVMIPSGLKIIPDGLFYGCQALMGIKMSYGVISIGKYAFYGCASLTRILIPASVTTIKESAFYQCKNLESVTVTENVKMIERWVFDQCAKLTRITFENSMGWKKVGGGLLSKISEKSLSDPYRAAEALRKTYVNMAIERT